MVLTLTRLAASGKLFVVLRLVRFIASSSKLVNSSRNFLSSAVSDSMESSSRIRLLNYITITYSIRHRLFTGLYYLFGVELLALANHFLYFGP
jgi:hypothetical protein